MSKIPKNAPKYCGFPVNPAIVEDLTHAMGDLTHNLYNVIKTENIVSQAWNSGVSASKGTHDNGYCIDWMTKHLTKDEIMQLCNSLNSNRFAAAFRYVGKDLGGGDIVESEHIHAAWFHKANYDLIEPTIQKGGSNYLPDIIKFHMGV